MTRDEAIQVLANFYVSNKNPMANHLCEAVYIAIQALKNEPKHGRWIKDKRVYGFSRCSECGSLWEQTFVDNLFTKYCPRCGARMDLIGEDKSHPFAESVMMGMDGGENE